MTRADLLVGVAFGLGGAGLLLVWCLLRIAARADQDAPAPPAPPAAGGVSVVETWLDRSVARPAPAEEPIRLLPPVVDEPELPAIDPEHANRLLAEIDRVLADVAAAAPVEAAAPRLHAVRDGCCPDHDPPACRRFAPCCGTCPTLPVS